MEASLRELISYGLTLEEAYRVCQERGVCKEEEFWRLMVGRTFPDLGIPVEGKGAHNWEEIYNNLVSFTRSQPYFTLQGERENYFTILHRNAALVKSRDFFFFLPSRPLSRGKELLFILGFYKDNFTPGDVEDFYNSWVKARENTFSTRSPQARRDFSKSYGSNPRLGIFAPKGR